MHTSKITPFPAPTQLATGGHVHYDTNSLTITFDDIHYSLSTGQLNGGYHHTLAVRNQKLNFFITTEQDLPGGSVANYLASEFETLDLPIHFCTALLTSADMTKHVYTKVVQDDCIVETIITAGIEQTAHTAGDGYHYKEEKGEFCPPGTINILAFTNKALTDGTMAKALITITEAKSAALQDTNISSLQSTSIATGSATDGIILTIDTSGDILTDAGTFSLFGDTLAKAVRQGLVASLTTF